MFLSLYVFGSENFYLTIHFRTRAATSRGRRPSAARLDRRPRRGWSACPVRLKSSGPGRCSAGPVVTPVIPVPLGGDGVEVCGKGHGEPAGKPPHCGLLGSKHH